MSDLMNALIAAKLMGNGGGGGGGGLPPIETVETELLNKNISFVDSGMGAYAGQEAVDFSLSVGAVYTVNWDNVDYTCTAVEIDGGGMIIPVIGNVSIMGLTPDTGEPFMAFIPQAGTLALYTPSTAASHDVVISGMAQIPANGSGLVVEDGEWAEKPIALPPVEVLGNYNTTTHCVDLIDYTWDEVLALWGQKRDVILHVATTSASLSLRCAGFIHAEWRGWYMQNNGTKISFWGVSGETVPAGYFTEMVVTVS